MDEEKIKQIAESVAQSVYNQNQSGSQFAVSQIPFHTHNGTDSSRVKQGSIIPGTTSLIGLKSIASETLTLNTTQDITIISLCGFAANNVSAPATKRAIINGNAQLGSCFNYTGWPGSATSIPVVGTISSFLQTCNSMYFYAGATVVANLTTTAPMFLGDVSANLSAAFAYASGNYLTFFSNGDKRGADYVNGSANIYWTGGLTGGATTAITTVMSPIYNKVAASEEYLVYVVDETSAVVATIKIIDWTGTAIVFQIVLATDWEISYYLSMS